MHDFLELLQKLSNSDFSAHKLRFTPNALPKLNYPGTRVNNIEIKPNETNTKLAATNSNFHLSPLIEEQEEYKVTPILSHGQLLATSTPPQSPKLVTTNVLKVLSPHSPHRAPPPIPIDVEPHQYDASNSTIATTHELPGTKRLRKVRFDIEEPPEPPPIPPRSTACPPTIPSVISANPVTQFPVHVFLSPMSPPTNSLLQSADDD